MKGAPPPATPCGHKPLSVFVLRPNTRGRPVGWCRLRFAQPLTSFAGSDRRISFSGQDFPIKPGRSPKITGDLPEKPAFFCPELPAAVSLPSPTVTDVPKVGTSVMKKCYFFTDVPFAGTSGTLGEEKRGFRAGQGYGRSSEMAGIFVY